MIPLKKSNNVNYWQIKMIKLIGYIGKVNWKQTIIQIWLGVLMVEKNTEKPNVKIVFMDRSSRLALW